MVFTFVHLNQRYMPEHYTMALNTFKGLSRSAYPIKESAVYA